MRREKRTVIVNLLYGKRVGILAKKCSLYSPWTIASKASCCSLGLIDGGNLPLTSQFSSAMATLSASKLASSSSLNLWLAACLCERLGGADVDVATAAPSVPTFDVINKINKIMTR